MAIKPTTASTAALPANPSLQPKHVYVMSVTCLVAGLAIGFLAQGLQSSGFPKSSPHVASAGTSSSSASAMHGGHTLSFGDMKQIADRQAAPLLQELKSDPNNTALLLKVAAIYHTSHQFKDAATYYDRAVQADPKNVAARTKLAISLYRSGDVDGAIAQLNHALSNDPKDPNALFNLGMIRLQGKQDGKGALVDWQRLLKTNPQLSAAQRDQVQKLMAGVLTMLSDQHGMEGGRGVDRHRPSSN